MSSNNKYTFTEFVKYLFTNKDRLAILTLIIYFIGVIYQFIKIVGIDKPLDPSILVFFNFYNSLNDFFSIVGYAFWFFILTFLLALIFFGFIFIFDTNKNFNSKIYFWYGIIINLFFIGIFLFLDSIRGVNILSVVVIIIFITLSLYIVYSVFYDNKKSINWYYTIISSYIIFSFIVLLTGGKYYACNQKDILPTDLKDKTKCMILNYKNDKYGFTGKGDVYKLDEFKSFYTYDFLESLKEKTVIKKEVNEN